MGPDAAASRTPPADGVAIPTSWPDHPLRQRYSLATHDAGFAITCRLMLGPLPYAALRFVLVLGVLAASVLWLGASLAEAIWLSTRSSGCGVLCLACGLLTYGAFWRRLLRPEPHLVECAHLAAPTERLTGGPIDETSGARFFRRRRIARQRLRWGNGLLALRARLRAVLASFHGTIDWAAELVPAPLHGAAGVDLMLRAVGAYLDRAVLSYDLARQDSAPWRASKDCLIVTPKEVGM